jgi:hypothetical protein
MGRVSLAGKMSFENVGMNLLKPEDIKGAPIYAPKMQSNPYKTPTEAKVALVEMEKTLRHMKLAVRYVEDGKAYKREVRKADRRYNSVIRKLRKARKSE